MSLKSLIQTGTKLWLDSIDPDLVQKNYALGAVGATSNPIIVADLVKTGRFDDRMKHLFDQGLSDEEVAWALTDQLVSQAQEVFHPVYEKTKANTGYVSFELDPLIEDFDANLPHDQRVKRYIELGKHWGSGRGNRMIKVPATPAGLDALEDLASAGIPLNVTLIFSERQYITARDNIWRGAQKLADKSRFKSVYSIFVSRVDIYTEKHIPSLIPEAQGQVGIVNAKRIWALNQAFWKDKNLPLEQEMVFASTGTKKPDDPKDKYVAALAGSDIQTNPPATNDAVDRMNKTYTRQIDKLPPDHVLKDIDQKVDPKEMERVLMLEGLEKFATPQKDLIKTISSKRDSLS
ncbi:MAG: transaldolase [Phycisphaerae bacterium]|jgi:transaldolase|nr:MAG: transaldolase [Phycisphaerae bacterium]